MSILKEKSHLFTAATLSSRSGIDSHETQKNVEITGSEGSNWDKVSERFRILRDTLNEDDLQDNGVPDLGEKSEELEGRKEWLPENDVPATDSELEEFQRSQDAERERMLDKANEIGPKEPLPPKGLSLDLKNDGVNSDEDTGQQPENNSGDDESSPAQDDGGVIP